jgi:hypothetical protein
MVGSDFNSAFFLAIAGIATAFISGLVVYCIKSKCTNFELCYGLVKVERNVQVELEEDKAQLEHGINPYNTIQTNK